MDMPKMDDPSQPFFHEIAEVKRFPADSSRDESVRTVPMTHAAGASSTAIILPWP